MKYSTNMPAHLPQTDFRDFWYLQKKMWWPHNKEWQRTTLAMFHPNDPFPFTCVSAFVEILQSIQCKIFKYTFLRQYPMKSWDFFFICKIQQPAWLQLSHRKLGPSEMGFLKPLYLKTEEHSFKCDILLWKTLIRVSIEF